MTTTNLPTEQVLEQLRVAQKEKYETREMFEEYKERIQK
jgi:hypothetical protein